MQKLPLARLGHRLRSGYATSANVGLIRFRVRDFGALRLPLVVRVRDFVGPGSLLAVRVRDLGRATDQGSGLERNKMHSNRRFCLPEVFERKKNSPELF